MNILYKYYSSSFDIKNHLESPAIKLAHVKSFNDPFETQISDIHAEKLADMIIQSSNTIDEVTKRNFVHSYKLISSLFGVVSLTETHRNILMWSHYASSHKGICVGYDIDFFDRLEKEKGGIAKNEAIIQYSPKRVIYDSKRFDLEQKIELDETLESIINAMGKKSDEWIYEKEHRCIVPFTWADKFIAHDWCPKSKLKRINKEYGQPQGEKANEYYFSYPNRSLDVYSIAQSNDFTVLKEISLESINSIYIGSNFGFKETCSLKTLIDSNPQKYSHIRLYKYEINPNDFALDILPLANVNLTYALDELTKNRVLQYSL